MICRSNYRKALALALAAGTSGGALAQSAPAPALAAGNKQEAPPETGVLSDIVVTARKTSENVQRAPASIISVSGGALTSQSIVDPVQLQKVLPSASLHEEGAVTQTFIRGIGSRSDFPWLPTASVFLFNNILIPRYGTTGMIFDLGSMQSIAGPQGTLYGGSAAGGAINLFGERPTNDFSGTAQVNYGSYNFLNAMVAQNIGLGEKASFRGAVDYSRHDGYLSRGLDAQNRVSGRGSLNLAPTDGLTALFFVNAARETGKPSAPLVLNPIQSHPRRLPATGPNGNPIDAAYTSQDNKTIVVGANIDWKVGNSTLTYIPGFVHVKDDYTFFIGGYNQLDVHDKENQHSEELRFSSEVGRLKFSIGAFYLRNKIDFSYGIGLALIPRAPYYVNIPLNATRQTNTSYALYGQAVLSLNDALRITGGVRSSNDKIDASGIGGAGAFRFNRSHTHVDWKAGVDLDLAPRVLVYANVQTGYIPFGYNPDEVPSDLVPESRLLSYSGGIKGRFFDNRLEINDEVFYYDYRKFQAIDFVNATGKSTVLNADRGTIYGNDLSVRALLTRDTQADASIVLLHSRFDRFEGIGYNYTGNRFVNAPKLNLIAGVQHTLHLGAGSLLGRVSTHYESGHEGEFTNKASTRQHRYIATDLSLTFTPQSDHWSLQVYLNNVENAHIFGTINSVTADRGGGPLAPPRTLGVRGTAKW